MSDATRRIWLRRPPRRREGFLRALSGNVAGNVLPLAAVGTLILAGLVGGGVDMARAYKADRRLQAACDAGALAGRRAVTTNGFDTAAHAQADQYFNANYDSAAEGTADANFTASSQDNGNTVVGTATASQSTIIMRIFGFDTIPLSVNCTASMGIGNSDVMFVLDNTGSMAWTPEGHNTSDSTATRIYALKQAMRAFYDTVAAANGGSNARIRYGFVPYSSTVNVGALLMGLNSNYVADTMTVSTRLPVNWGPVAETWTDSGRPTRERSGNFSQYSNTKYGSQTTCEAAMPPDETSWNTYDTDPAGTNSTFDPTRGANGQKVTATGTQLYQRKADYECVYKGGYSKGWFVNSAWITREITSYTYEARDPVIVETYDTPFSDWLYTSWPVNVSAYKTGNARRLVSSRYGNTRWSDDASWPGCIQERETTPASSFSFVSLATGITPSGALDLDIDAAPTSDSATKWKPLWEEITFRRSSTSGTPTEATFSGDSSTASTYCPYRSQLLTEMSKSSFGDYVDRLTPTGSTYHDIGLLWGARLSSPTGIFAANVNAVPGNGGTVSRHLIFMTDGELQPSSTINSAYGIEANDRRITTDGRSSSQYTNHRSRYLAICEAIKARGIRLWVIAFGADVTLSSDLVSCASSNSAFKAADSADLDKYFQEIAKQVGELRITQ